MKFFLNFLTTFFNNEIKEFLIMKYFNNNIRAFAQHFTNFIVKKCMQSGMKSKFYTNKGRNTFSFDFFYYTKITLIKLKTWFPY